jgi:hypothetical protein
LLLAKAVEAMAAHSALTREALVRAGVLVELSHASMRDAAGIYIQIHTHTHTHTHTQTHRHTDTDTGTPTDTDTYIYIYID